MLLIVVRTEQELEDASFGVVEDSVEHEKSTIEDLRDHRQKQQRMFLKQHTDPPPQQRTNMQSSELTKRGGETTRKT
jgi:hypothetical protein